MDPSTGTYHVSASGVEEDVSSIDTFGGGETLQTLGAATPGYNEDAISQPQSAPIDAPRAALIAADHETGDIHHDNLYVQIDGGPIMYYTTIPARRVDNGLPDQGLLWHQFSRDGNTYTLYAASSTVDGLESGLSAPISVPFNYIDYSTDGCTEQTVPVADPGTDVIVQVGNSVALDASGSFDPHGPDTTDLVYRWNLFAAPEDPEYATDTVSTSFTPTQTGRYYFRLHVWDQIMTEVLPITFNPSPIRYVRVSVVDDDTDPDLVEANAGPPQEAGIDEQVTLDGSRSIGPSGTTYSWEHVNPLDNKSLRVLASVLGTTSGSGGYHKVNYDEDFDVDGEDLAKMANNWGAVAIAQGIRLWLSLRRRFPGPIFSG